MFPEEVVSYCRHLGLLGRSKIGSLPVRHAAHGVGPDQGPTCRAVGGWSQGGLYGDLLGGELPT